MKKLSLPDSLTHVHNLHRGLKASRRHCYRAASADEHPAQVRHVVPWQLGHVRVRGLYGCYRNEGRQSSSIKDALSALRNSSGFEFPEAKD